jgi:hypothetical protein
MGVLSAPRNRIKNKNLTDSGNYPPFIPLPPTAPLLWVACESVDARARLGDMSV